VIGIIRKGSTMPYEEYVITNDDALAAERAARFRETDPFEREIPRALLSKDHIREYVRVTGMLCPFYPDEEHRLKAASYEAWPVRFIRWDEDGRKHIDEVSTQNYKKRGYELPANSITFVQIESKIRLPHYIALRFNLRITHVHRGLLLGTGPLVDPGFSGDLLIPLHNLTSEPYRIQDGVIWIEFTKMSSSSAPSTDFVNRKRDVSFETYFERANRNNPIQSSIHLAVKKAGVLAEQARADARKAVRTNRFFAGIGFLALLALILAAANFAVSVVRDANQAGRDASQAVAETHRLVNENSIIQKELDESKRQLQEMQARVSDIRQQVDQLRVRPGQSQRP
jgi:deoxycytidine triphosphate deaminase